MFFMVWGIQLFRLALRNNTVFYQLVKICKSRFSERPLLSDLWEWCITCNYFFCRMTNPWNFVYDKRRYHLCFGISSTLWHGKTVPCHRVELLWRILVRSIDTALWLIKWWAKCYHCPSRFYDYMRYNALSRWFPRSQSPSHTPVYYSSFRPILRHFLPLAVL